MADAPRKGLSARLAAETARLTDLPPYTQPSPAEVEAVARTLSNRAGTPNWEGYILAARTALIAARLVVGEYGETSQKDVREAVRKGYSTSRGLAVDLVVESVMRHLTEALALRPEKTA